MTMSSMMVVMTSSCDVVDPGSVAALLVLAMSFLDKRTHPQL